MVLNGFHIIRNTKKYRYYRDVSQAVHTQSKILGSRDVLYKYLNKNMIFVATVTPKAAQHIGSATPEEAGLVAYLIDTVTGRVLHRVSHPFMQGPVHAVRCFYCFSLSILSHC